jgi:hypothetical protein
MRSKSRGRIPALQFTAKKSLTINIYPEFMICNLYSKFSKVQYKEYEMLKRVLILSLLVVIMSCSLMAETLQETLESLSGSAARGYVNPMVTSFGSDMNGGWFHKAPSDSLFSWDLEFGIVMMGTLFTSKDKDFFVNGSFSFTREQAREMASAYQDEDIYNALVDQIVSQTFDVNIYGPTITGAAYDEATEENSVTIEFPSQVVEFTYNDATEQRTLPAYMKKLGVGGLLEDLPFLPLAAPQLSIGTAYGTMLSFRYLPDLELTPEIGKLKYLGFGIQHNPAVWIPVDIPVSLAASFFTQNLEIGTIAEATASTFGLNVSKTFGMNLLSITPYAGIAYETSHMKFHYDYPIEFNESGIAVDTIPIRFEVDGKNTSRFTTGLSFRIGFFNLNADYNFAQYPSASAGAMFNFSF